VENHTRNIYSSYLPIRLTCCEYDAACIRNIRYYLVQWSNIIYTLRL